MPSSSWWPITELRLIFRHGVVYLAIMLVYFACSRASVYLIPDAKPYADLIDIFVLLAVLAILALKLVWGLIVELFFGSGFNAIVAT
jgi:hypothetical protein